MRSGIRIMLLGAALALTEAFAPAHIARPHRSSSLCVQNSRAQVALQIGEEWVHLCWRI